jgi:hypothetical protein
MQLVQENKCLWRIKNNYLDDTKECPDCTVFWNKLIDQKEENVKKLTELVKKALM